MPLTCANFLSLVREKFYDGLHFHRVIKGFMLQFGCPHSKNPTSRDAGTGGPSPKSTFELYDGSTVTRNSEGCIEDEHTAKLSNLMFTLSMANAGPNSGGSQFFINTVNNKNLDWWSGPKASKHPVFGKVVEGTPVVKKIEKVATDGGDMPRKPIKVTSITIL